MHNDYQELSKKDKKIVRELIDKGIAEDFRKGMQHFDQLIQQLKISAETPQEQYYKLFNEVRDFDKQIGRMYDGRTGSRYLGILANQIAIGLIDLSELEDLNTDVKERLIRHVNLLKE
ncbi:hypothetical protein ACCC92_14515 [Mucilaginibacter sp. Mucisp84]|uniref:hypothetical protein n=1 Tax=Mucilaginibacter sp. Mucisp84 TaxID=3243058 RepID=UPI0039A539A3